MKYLLERQVPNDQHPLFSDRFHFSCIHLGRSSLYQLNKIIMISMTTHDLQDHVTQLKAYDRLGDMRGDAIPRVSK